MNIKYKYEIFHQICMFFYCFEEVLTSRKPKIMTLSTTCTLLFIVDFAISTSTKQDTGIPLTPLTSTC